MEKDKEQAKQEEKPMEGKENSGKEEAQVTEEQVRKAKEKKQKKQKKKEKKEKKEKKPQGQSANGKGKEKETFDFDKSADFAEWYNQIIQSADIVDQRYPVKGMPVFTPYGFHMHSKIMDLIEAEWEKMGHLKAQFPTCIPETFLRKEGDHVKGFEKECFWVTKGGLNELEVRLALRPTSETAMYHMFSLWVRSYMDLPLKIHQTCTVFRHETKDTRPLIRVREIPWNEAHTAHATREEALANLDDAWRGYLHVINDLLGVYGLKLRRPEWDKFAGAEHTDVLDCVMPCGRVLQCVGAHFLGQKFAKVFDIKYLDEQNDWKHTWMTCYGVSTRLLAATISLHGDRKGLVLPPAVAQYQVVIVPIIMKKKDQRPLEMAEKVKELLTSAGVRCTVDNRDSKPGEKYYYWEMKGVPLRCEIGPRDCDNEQVRLVRRDNGDKVDVKIVDLAGGVRNVLEEMMGAMRERALQHHESVITDCSSLAEVEAVMKSQHGGFARVPFCSMGMDGKEPDKVIHEAGGGEVRGFLPGEAPPPEGTKCVCCTDRPAVVYAYVARAY